MSEAPIPFKKGGTGSGMGDVQTVEPGKSSVSVYPDPKTYRGSFKSATNPNGVGSAGPTSGPTSGS